MSISTYQGNIVRLQRDLAALQGKLSDKTRKEADLTGKIGRISGDMNGRISPATLASKLRDLEKTQKELADTQRDRARVQEEIARKNEELHRSQSSLSSEMERERKRVDDLEKRQHRERMSREKELRSAIESTKRASLAPRPPHEIEIANASAEKEYDFFVSHASEDKEEFVRPLVEALNKLGCRTWYDEHQLKVGDSLRRNIDKGIARSRFGIVVLSEHFFAKEWPQKELDGLTAIEIQGAKIVLPIWHKVTKDEVASRSPMLADKVALNSSTLTIVEIAQQLASLLDPNI